MFRAHPDTEPTSGKLPEVRSDELIPLSVLRLDLPHVDATFLAGRGTEIVLDSLGREAVSHSDAKRLSLNSLSMRRGRPRCSAPPTAPPRNTTANGAA